MKHRRYTRNRIEFIPVQFCEKCHATITPSMAAAHDVTVGISCYERRHYEWLCPKCTRIVLAA